MTLLRLHWHGDATKLLAFHQAVCSRILSHATPAEAAGFIKELADDVDYADKSILQSVAMVTKRVSVFLTKAELELFGSIPARVAEVAPRRKTLPSSETLPAANPFGVLFGAHTGAGASAAANAAAGGTSSTTMPSGAAALVDIDPALYKKEMADFGW